MSTNFVSTIVYEEGKIFKWLLKEQRNSYYLIGLPEEYEEKANHLDNQVEVEGILGFLCDANSNEDQYLHGQSEEHDKDILQIIREAIYSIQEEQKELLAYANLRLKHNDIESGSTANANYPGKESPLNLIEEKKQKSLVNDDSSTIDIENDSTVNANNPAKESAFSSIEGKKQESVASDDPSAVEIANNCEARDEQLGVELDIEMALSISELEEDINKQEMRTLGRGFELIVQSIKQYRLGL